MTAVVLICAGTVLAIMVTVAVGLVLTVRIYATENAQLGITLGETIRERDSYSDALATVMDQAGRGDLDGVVAHARQALEGGDYHGRLRAAQEALEAASAWEAEEADLLSCSCGDEARSL